MNRTAVENIAGFGAKLRARLKAAGMSQKSLARATGLSRQTIASALSDRVSATTAGLIDEVLRRLSLGSTRKDSSESDATDLPVRSRSDIWATASQIDEWASRREAQEDFPRLIRRLILLNTPDATQVAFRASEGIQLHGVDGVVETVSGSALTPQGKSVWELGTGANPNAKATEDYAKRLPSADETFVFVTAKRWSGKDAWAAARREKKQWRDVRAYDADDIETWLELTPSVHLWFSVRVGIVPPECVDLEYWWHTWQRATNPRLGAGFVLSGRGEKATEIVKLLANHQSVFAVQAESQDEAIAVFAAALEQSSAIDSDEVFARFVVVEQQSAWRHLAAARTPLVLVPLFDVTNLVAAATEGGHTVVLPLGSAHPDQNDSIAKVEVGPIAREPAVEYLNASGANLRESQWELASLARRSMTAFRRQVAIAPSLRRPLWADPAIARDVLPALFLGSWNDDRGGDRSAVTSLSHTSYEQFVARISAFTNTPDSLLRRRGTLWYLVSPLDAWRQLGRHVSAEDLRHFSRIAIEVFGTVDPRLDLPHDKQWLSGMLLPKPPHSKALSRGMAATIALLGSRADAVGQREGNDLILGFADALVHELFTRTRTEPKLWASIDQLVPEFAEAAPDVFLAELERGLGDPTQPLASLFADSDSSGFGPSSPHIHVLWALERLAWSPDFLLRVVRVLGRLDSIDPGGRTVNRPRATLRSIFLPWLPQTAATADQRLEVLNAWVGDGGEAAWHTLLSMLPEIHGIGHYSARPRWRDWYPEKPIVVSRGDHWRAIRFAALKLLDLAGKDGSRWKDIVESLPRFPEPEHDIALSRLAEIDPSAVGNESRSAIWNALRELIAQHRNYSDASWALPANKLEKIDGVRRRFEPSDVVARYGWLFSWRPDFPDAPIVSRDPGYEEYVQVRQIEGARTILDEAGVAGLVAVATSAKNPHALGRSVARIGVLADEMSFLRENLGHTESAREELAYAYILGRAQALGLQEGQNWILKMFSEFLDWAPRQRAVLLIAAEPSPNIWTMAASDVAVATEYWKRMSLYHVDKALVPEAAKSLLAYGQPFRAISLLGNHASKELPDPHIVLDALEAATFSETTDQPDGMFTHYVETLLDYLCERDDPDELRIGRLEWALLPVITRHERTPRMLKRAFLRDPSLFVDAITWIYKGRNDPPRDEESADDGVRDRASRAYDLLRSMRAIPGTKHDGSLDGAALRSWVDRARSSLAARDRLEVGTHEIGQLLGASAARSPDGAWPSVPIRDLVEALQSEEFDRGISMGLYNSRGATTRSMTTGGEPERALASQYFDYANMVSTAWPRTAGLLRTIAKAYVSESKHHDHDVAVQEDLGS